MRRSMNAVASRPLNVPRGRRFRVAGVIALALAALLSLDTAGAFGASAAPDAGSPQGSAPDLPTGIPAGSFLPRV